MKRLLPLLLLLVVFTSTPGRAATTSLYWTNLSNEQFDTPNEEQTDWFTQEENSACPSSLTWWPCDDTYHPRTDGASAGATWVVRNSEIRRCFWDSDDHALYYTGGTLRAGQTFGRTDCIVAQTKSFLKTNYDQTGWWYHSPMTTEVTARSARPFALKICYSPQSWCLSVPATYDRVARVYEYLACVEVAYDANRSFDRTKSTVHNLVLLPDSEVQRLPNTNAPGYGLVSQVTVSATNTSSQNIGKFALQVGYPGIAPKSCVSHVESPSAWSSTYPFAWSFQGD